MTYSGSEKRKHPRISGRFIVSYRMLQENDKIDISQTRNISLGGMLITTNRQFDPGAQLVLEIRLPFDPHPIMLIGRVIKSKEITHNVIYDTRLQFIAVDDKHKGIIDEMIGYYMKRSNWHQPSESAPHRPSKSAPTRGGFKTYDIG